MTIVLFGATGYTGRLTAEAMVRRGLRPVLAGRSPSELAEMATQMGGLEVAVADASHPATVRDIVEKGDVLVSTVGPFTTWGRAAIEAAITMGAHYVDSNGEPDFTRRVFEGYGREAFRSGVCVMTAFGWECVLGNLAAALALSEAGVAAVQVDTGYFYAGRSGFSGGTLASFASAAVGSSFAYRDGALRTVPGAERYRTMPVDGIQRPAVSFGASEHFALPATFPALREVNAYLGWFGRFPPQVARGLHVTSRIASPVLEIKPLRALIEAVVRRLLRGSTGGPTEGERVKAGVRVIAIAYDRDRKMLGGARLQGPEGYEFTAAILAWGAEQIADGAMRKTGAIGPVDAFGIEELHAGCREAGVDLAKP